jgi:hypothetical protein
MTQSQTVRLYDPFLEQWTTVTIEYNPSDHSHTLSCDLCTLMFGRYGVCVHERAAIARIFGQQYVLEEVKVIPGPPESPTPDWLVEDRRVDDSCDEGDGPILCANCNEFAVDRSDLRCGHCGRVGDVDPDDLIENTDADERTDEEAG